MGSAPGRVKEPHLFFTIVEHKPKTVVVGVENRRSGDWLGEIRYYAPWRQYCFMPAENTIWSPSCLDEVRAEIARLMQERRAAREE